MRGMTMAAHAGRGAAAAAVIALGVALAGCQPAPATTTAAMAPAGTTPATTTGPADAARVPLAIETAGGTRRFAVEVARTEAEQARGLMFRTVLAPDAGMIFPFDPPRPASFWMRNTLIPLDMIFVRADGVIARIAENTVPKSLDPVDSGETVAAVLEIAGGRARALGVRPGDRVRWPG